MQASVDIFNIWPSLDEMATSLGEKRDTVYRWQLRRRIPDDAWQAVIDAAAAKGRALSAAELLAFNKPTKRRGGRTQRAITAKRRRAEARAS
jgi:hypothetical protein